MKKRTAICLGLAIAMIVLAGVIAISPVCRVRSVHEYLITKYYRFENLGMEEIVQEFEPQYNRLESVELFLANLYPETEGEICLSIVDSAGKTIFQKKYKASSIPTGDFYEYRIGKKVRVGERYELRLFYQGNSEEVPQVMISERNKNLNETGTMYVEGNASEYNMAITYYYSQKSLF